MSEVRLSATSKSHTQLWRYMSLEKLIDLLATSKMFFSPLSSLYETDPFEGYLPRVALQAEETIVRDILGDAYEEGKLQKVFKKVSSSVCVNCWHANSYESEAMWRIYSDYGKAIAIETTVEALKNAIEVEPPPHSVHIHRVKYVDFLDNALTVQDCKVEGHGVPLLKRRSYEHEKEVRAFIYATPVASTAAVGDHVKPSPLRLPIDVKLLIGRIHVSPLSDDLFRSAVRTICNLFGVGADLVTPSRLLLGQDDLWASDASDSSGDD